MYGGGEVAEKMANSLSDYRPSMTERLKNERARVAQRLTELDAAIGALEANPQVQSVLDLIQKVSHL